MRKHIILTLLLLFCLSLPCLSQERWGRDGAWGRVDPQWGRGLEAWTLEDLPYIVDWWRIEEGVTTDGASSDSGDVVWAWYGSINGLSIAQSDNSKRPEYRTDQINGHPAIVFDGADDYLQGAFGATYAQPNTIIIVCSLPTENYYRVICDGSHSAHRHSLWYYHTLPYSYAQCAHTSVTRVTYVSGSGFKILTSVFNRASSIFRVNGTDYSPVGDVGDDPLDGFTLSTKHDGAFPADNSVTDLLIVNAGLTTGLLQRAERWLNEHRRGIY